MEDIDLKISYYAVIPANVRYDKRLPANAKLLYGEITALCNSKGYCWAENKYFSDLYSVSKVSISKWIKNLCDCGYIESSITYKTGSKEIDKRYITILNDPIKEKFNTPLTKVNDPIKEKFKDNNTTNNTTNNNICPFFENLWKNYPNKKGKNKVSKKALKEINLVGEEKMLKAIERYKKSIVGTDEKYIKHGSTFFNGDYVDYLQEAPKYNNNFGHDMGDMEHSLKDNPVVRFGVDMV